MGLFDIFKKNKEGQKPVEFVLDCPIMQYRGKDEALAQAKEMYKRLTKKGADNVRLNPNHPNIVEVKEKETGEWIPLTVFIDPKNRFIPK